MSIKKELQKELSRRSYIDYVEYVHKGKWLRGKHLVFICEQIEKLLDGEFNNLIISLPPQSGKSTTISETLPSYFIGKFPERRVICAGYSEDFARRFGRRNRQKIEEFGKELFDIELSHNRNGDTDFEIEGTTGGMISRGVLSGITGNPAELIIIDDPIKNRMEADSPTYRNRLWAEWLDSIKTRQSADCKTILIQTRWHEDDLAGRLIKDEPNKWRVINIPMEAEDNDILGRKKGDALFPEIGKDKKWLESFKKGYMSKEGSRTWNSLYQGNPTTEEGNIVKRNWFKYYEDYPAIGFTLISVDATFKDGVNNDFVAIQVWGKTGNKKYLLDRLKARLDFPGTINAIQMMKSKFPNANMILIEDKANGSAIIQVLRKTMNGVVGVNPEGGKVSRLNAISPEIEAGNVYLPKHAIWLEEYIDEMVGFPNMKHDDDVDATSQALNKLRNITADIIELSEEEKYRLLKYREKVQGIAGIKAPRDFIRYR